jgi:hypothetical protein
MNPVTSFCRPEFEDELPFAVHWTNAQPSRISAHVRQYEKSPLSSKSSVSEPEPGKPRRKSRKSGDVLKESLVISKKSRPNPISLSSAFESGWLGTPVFCNESTEELRNLSFIKSSSSSPGSTGSNSRSSTYYQSLDWESLNILTDEEKGLLKEVRRPSLGQHRSTFVAYARAAAVSKGNRFLVKGLYSTSSNSDCIEVARFLGIEKLFYRLVLENAGLIRSSSAA